MTIVVIEKTIGLLGSIGLAARAGEGEVNDVDGAIESRGTEIEPVVSNAIVAVARDFDNEKVLGCTAFTRFQVTGLHDGADVTLNVGSFDAWHIPTSWTFISVLGNKVLVALARERRAEPLPADDNVVPGDPPAAAVIRT